MSEPYSDHPLDSQLRSLDLLGCAVVIIETDGHCRFLNQAAEQLFEVSPRGLRGHAFARLFQNGGLIDDLILDAQMGLYSRKSLDIRLERFAKPAMDLALTVVSLETGPGRLLLEFRENDQRMKVEREVQMIESVSANRELLRNLAHEVKNPLGGIRGAAQLLETEHPEATIREFTQVIIKEADRLQKLVDRLLAPHRNPRRMTQVNIHEVCERVRSVLLAEYGQPLIIVRDYDASLPELNGDREQLIQAVLNLARNAAQAMHGNGEIRLMTRVARQATVARKRYKLALDLHVIDNGPGVPQELKDKLFYPLVSGREGGTGLGLSLAQTFVQQHGGLIECDSRPGLTDFRVLLPLA